MLNSSYLIKGNITSKVDRNSKNQESIGIVSATLNNSAIQAENNRMITGNIYQATSAANGTKLITAWAGGTRAVSTVA